MRKTVKILVGLLIVALLIAATWIGREFQPWMPTGKDVHVGNTHIADYDFQVCQRKNPGSTEAFTTWLFARKQGGKWMPFMLGFDDTYRPSIAFREEASGIAVLRWCQRGGDMKMAVVGVTGATGRRVVKHILAQGHFVTAVARHPERLPSADRLSFVRGDVLSPGGLAGALDGVEAVISCIDQKRTYRQERSCQSVSPAFSPNAKVQRPAIHIAKWHRLERWTRALLSQPLCRPAAFCRSALPSVTIRKCACVRGL